MSIWFAAFLFFYDVKASEKTNIPVFTIHQAITAMALKHHSLSIFLKGKGYHSIPNSDNNLLCERAPAIDVHPLDDVFKKGNFYVRSFICISDNYINKSFAWNENEIADTLSIIKDLKSAGFKQTGYSPGYPLIDIYWKTWAFTNKKGDITATITSEIPYPYETKSTYVHDQLSVRLIQHWKGINHDLIGLNSGMVDSLLKLAIMPKTSLNPLTLSQAFKVSQLSTLSQEFYLKKLGFKRVDTTKASFQFVSDTMDKELSISIFKGDSTQNTVAWHQREDISSGVLTDLLKNGFIRTQFWFCCNLKVEKFLNLSNNQSVTVQIEDVFPQRVDVFFSYPIPSYSAHQRH